MAPTIHVRFLNNFILTVVQTVEEDGKLVVREKSFHIAMGDVYPISQYQRHTDDRLDLEFPDTCPLAGLAQNIEADYCSLVDSKAKAAAAKPQGCGGCGNKNKKKTN